MEDKRPMVSIICLCYNHERYIEQALNGMLMQETEYSYEILVNDDKSTDSSSKILKEYEEKYSDKIKVTYQKENMYSRGINVSAYLIEKAQGKYIAFCEGDDFWIDTHKLQKQVSFMEEHHEYSMTAHAAYVAYEDGVIKKQIFCPYDHETDISVEEILSGWRLPTASLIYRRSVQKDIIPPYRKDAKVGDFCLGFYMALQGKVHFFKQPMSVYRYMSVSSVMAPLLRNRDELAKHQENMIALLQRMDEYTDYRYHGVVQVAQNGFLYNKYYILGDLKEIKKFSIYQEKSLIEKIKLFFKQFSFMYYTKHVIKGVIDRYIIYPMRKRITKKMKLDNLMILEPIK